MTGIESFLDGHADAGLIAWKHQADAARRFNLTVGETERIILERGLLPARYQRNRSTISVDAQRMLLASQVTVIGCGGLGGFVVEHLARLGVGRLVVVDPDLFEEHNLNRQTLSRLDNLGTPKVAAAALRVAEINPAVTLVPVQVAFSPDNGAQLLSGSRVAVDALDNVQNRLELAQACDRLGIPVVHGAIAGWYGQLATHLPGGGVIQQIYSTGSTQAGVEQELGNPAFTPAAVASLQAAAICKLLLGLEQPVTPRKLVIDLWHMEVDELPVLAESRS